MGGDAHRGIRQPPTPLRRLKCEGLAAHVRGLRRLLLIGGHLHHCDTPLVLIQVETVKLKAPQAVILRVAHGVRDALMVTVHLMVARAAHAFERLLLLLSRPRRVHADLDRLTFLHVRAATQVVRIILWIRCDPRRLHPEHLKRLAHHLPASSVHKSLAGIVRRDAEQQCRRLRVVHLAHERVDSALQKVPRRAKLGAAILSSRTPLVDVPLCIHKHGQCAR